jgi:hypothetical protein
MHREDGGKEGCERGSYNSIGISINDDFTVIFGDSNGQRRGGSRVLEHLIICQCRLHRLKDTGSYIPGMKTVGSFALVQLYEARNLQCSI